jgi:hypothetical protein
VELSGFAFLSLGSWPRCVDSGLRNLEGRGYVMTNTDDLRWKFHICSNCGHLSPKDQCHQKTKYVTSSEVCPCWGSEDLTTAHRISSLTFNLKPYPWQSCLQNRSRDEEIAFSYLHKDWEPVCQSRPWWSVWETSSQPIAGGADINQFIEMIFEPNYSRHSWCYMFVINAEYIVNIYNYVFHIKCKYKNMHTAYIV